jgi:glycosyltransferase involved in cell wall biosynthesis
MAETCAVIPVYDHGRTAGRVVQAARDADLDVILVDDGSRPECGEALDAIAAADKRVHLLRHGSNQGKGAAVQTGLREAAALGYRNALQIDADGQHSLADIPRFLAESRANPAAVVCGRPVFGDDAPRARIYGRRLTNFWVSVHTWSRDIPDAMCGFRMYPLAATVPLLDKAGLGRRMDFDIEILVRLFWLGVPMRWLPTVIAYPPDGRSHFRMRLDNYLIARAHTVLFFGMLARAPALAARKLGLARSRWRAA